MADELWLQYAGEPPLEHFELTLFKFAMAPSLRMASLGLQHVLPSFYCPQIQKLPIAILTRVLNQ